MLSVWQRARGYMGELERKKEKCNNENMLCGKI